MLLLPRAAASIPWPKSLPVCLVNWPQHQSPFGSAWGLLFLYGVYFRDGSSVNMQGGTEGVAGALDYRDSRLAWVEGDLVEWPAPAVPPDTIPPYALRLPLPGRA